MNGLWGIKRLTNQRVDRPQTDEQTMDWRMDKGDY